MDRLSTGVLETLQSHMPRLAISTVFQQQIRDVWSEGLMSVTGTPHDGISEQSP